MTPIIGPTYALASRTADVQRAVGMYPVRIESGSGSNLWMLKSIPGLVARATGTGCLLYTSDAADE